MYNEAQKKVAKRGRLGGRRGAGLAVALWLALGAVSCGDSGTPDAETARPGPSVAGMAPDFTLATVEGGTVQLSRYRGQVVLVDFWATWCGPCRAELPHLREVRERYAERGFEIIGVSLDDSGAEAVRAFTRDNAIAYPVVIGDYELTQRYGGVEVIPTAFLVDREGRVVERFVGYKPAALLHEKIEPLL